MYTCIVCIVRYYLLMLLFIGLSFLQSGALQGVPDAGKDPRPGAPQNHGFDLWCCAQ